LVNVNCSIDPPIKCDLYHPASLTYFFFFSFRQQYVKLHDSTSNIITPSSGVPQGAILSPLLFSLLVNSAASVLRHARLLIFANDMKLFMRIHNEKMLVFFNLTSIV